MNYTFVILLAISSASYASGPPVSAIGSGMELLAAAAVMGIFGARKVVSRFKNKDRQD